MEEAIRFLICIYNGYDETEPLELASHVKFQSDVFLSLSEDAVEL